MQINASIELHYNASQACSLRKLLNGNKSAATVSVSIQVREEDEEDVPWAEEPMYT